MTNWTTVTQSAAMGCRIPSDSLTLDSEDARRWCNSMFSNNIRTLQNNQGNYSAICDDRGRVKGFLDVYCLNDQQFLCVLDGISRDEFLKRFNMFLILDDIEEEQRATELIHICGSSAEQILSNAKIPLPDSECIHLEAEGINIMRKNRFGVEGFDILADSPDKLEVTLIESGMSSCTIDDFNALRIFHGRAKWPNDGSEKSMIHELALNEQCCAFDKGCYLGQEIINRIDVKGLINKKIQRLSIEGQAQIGDRLCFEDSDVGLLSSLAQMNGDHYGVSVLKKKAWAKGSQLQLTSGGVATVL
jgi:folate-binding protein YgfZ